MFAVPTHPSSRRSFFGRAAASLAVAAGWLTPRRAGAGPALDGADADTALSDAWLTRLTGKHKQIVDAVSANEGWPLVFALNFRNSTTQASNLSDAQITSVVGLRHFSMPFALKDDAWAKYRIGEFLKIDDPQTKAPATRNFFYNPRPGDLWNLDAAIEKQQARGTIVTACNLALTVLSELSGKQVGVDAATAKREWEAALIPGVVLVPSGVYGLTRAQERGCAYCYGG